MKFFTRALDASKQNDVNLAGGVRGVPWLPRFEPSQRRLQILSYSLAFLKIFLNPKNCDV